MNTNEISSNLLEKSLFTRYQLQPTGNDCSWAPMYHLLDITSKKLEWPVANFDGLSQREKIVKLFKLKNDLKQQQQQQQVKVDLSKINKQVAFYSLCVFLNESIELHHVDNALFNDNLFMGFSLNEEDACKSNAKLSGVQRNVLSSLEYLLDLWLKLNMNKDLMTIVNKCVSNCKLDPAELFKRFNQDFFYVYRSVTENKKLNISDIASETNLKQRLQVISYLMLEEKSFKVSFKGFILFIAFKIFILIRKRRAWI